MKEYVNKWSKESKNFMIMWELCLNIVQELKKYSYAKKTISKQYF